MRIGTIVNDNIKKFQLITFVVINWISYIFMILLNICYGAGFLFPTSIGDVSNAFPTYITPAGYAFSIWSLIFVTQAVLCIFLSIPRYYNSHTQKLSVFLFLNYILNGFWGTVFIYELFLFSVIVILGILITLIIIYVIEDIGISAFEAIKQVKNGLKLIHSSELVAHFKEKKDSLITYWCVHFPTSIYLGWITVATTLSITIYLLNPPISLTSNQDIWAIVILIVILVLTIVMLITRMDVAYSSVIIWALIAIAVNQTDSVQITCYIIVAILSVLSILVFIIRIILFFNQTSDSLYVTYE